MHIEKLTLIDFKNYASQVLTFSPKVNCIVGLNGSGKTNILEAVHYLSMTRGAINLLDSANVRHGKDYFSIKGSWVKNDEKHDIVCYYQSGTKKSFKVNKQEYQKLSEHIGLFPVVLLTPYDTDLIREGSEIRRKFMDLILCQLDQKYLETLTKYNHYLKQRNAYLKSQNTIRNGVDHALLDQYNNELVKYGNEIHVKRAKFVEEFNAHFIDQYHWLTENKEQVVIRYTSDLLDQEFKQLLSDNIRKDLALERTTAGVHRDDYKFNLDGKAVKKFGSQGQQKSFVIALKLTQFSILKKELEVAPILLLDDIFDKLDNNRIGRLLNRISNDYFDQVFITDARHDRTLAFIEQADLEATFIKVEQGEVIND